jgi:hypothetical protein
MVVQLRMLDNEVLTMFCSQCKCCLATGTHCGTCHLKKPIEKLCGCGNCVERAQDYLEREKARVARVEANRAARAIND